MTAGHAIPFGMLQSVQGISDQIGEKAPLQWDGLEVS